MTSRTAGRAIAKGRAWGPAGALVTRGPIALGAVALGGLLLLVILAAALPIFGYRAEVIAGSSMEPAIHLGSLSVTQPAHPEDLRAGDIVTFRREGASVDVTHRIVAIDQVDGVTSYTTKGDANGSPDPTGVSFAGDVNRVVYNVPYAGYAISFVHSPQGLATLGLLLAIGLAMMFVLKMGSGKKAAESPSGG